MAAAPVIKASYAQKKVRYGDVLRIYIEAEAPAGEMHKIAIAVDQRGYGHYPTDWTYLRQNTNDTLKGIFNGILLAPVHPA